MAARTFVNRQVELMVWKCYDCGQERGYLEPGTTIEVIAHLLCDRCKGMMLHRVVPLKRRMFTVRQQL